MVVNLLFRDSTRTRISFETTAKRLFAGVIDFSAKGSSLSRGEPLKGTALVLRAMGADTVVVRHSFSGAAHRLAHAGWMELPVPNTGDGTHQHPTQVLLDAMTLRRHYKRDLSSSEVKSLTPSTDLEGARVVVVGDALHSCVARSNADPLTLLGAQITPVAPPTLLPVDTEGQACDVDYDLDHALAPGPGVVTMLRVQCERMDAADGGLLLSSGEYHAAHDLDHQRFRKLTEKTTVMHPGPMSRGLEISAEAADSLRAVVVEQISNGVSARTTVLYLLLAPERHSHD